jgi:fructose-bisphosphate aldolase class I
VLKTWKGEEGNVEIAQQALLKRAKANSDAQQGKYDPSAEDKEAAEGMYVKNYSY